MCGREALDAPPRRNVAMRLLAVALFTFGARHPACRPELIVGATVDSPAIPGGHSEGMLLGQENELVVPATGHDERERHGSDSDPHGCRVAQLAARSQRAHRRLIRG
jgi:hypothetical protein